VKFRKGGRKSRKTPTNVQAGGKKPLLKKQKGKRGKPSAQSRAGDKGSRSLSGNKEGEEGGNRKARGGRKKGPRRGFFTVSLSHIRKEREDKGGGGGMSGERVSEGGGDIHYQKSTFMGRMAKRFAWDGGKTREKEKRRPRGKKGGHIISLSPRQTCGPRAFQKKKKKKKTCTNGRGKGGLSRKIWGEKTRNQQSWGRNFLLQHSGQVAICGSKESGNGEKVVGRHS